MVNTATIVTNVTTVANQSLNKIDSDITDIEFAARAILDVDRTQRDVPRAVRGRRTHLP